MVQRKIKKYSELIESASFIDFVNNNILVTIDSECFSIRYNNQSEMVEVTLQTVSKEAK